MNSIKKQPSLFYVCLFFAFAGGLIMGVCLIKPQLSGYQENLIQRHFYIRDMHKKKERTGEEAVRENIVDRFYRLDPFYQNVQADRFIHIKTREDVNQKQRELIQTIWGNPTLPLSLLPRLDQSDVPVKALEKFENLKKVDKYTVSMDYGLSSVIYLFYPRENNEKGVVIYHEGHQGKITNGGLVFKNLIYYGFTVAALSMPLLGENNQPETDIGELGSLKLQLHDQFKFLDYPLRFFMEPVAATVNFFEKNNPDQPIFMMGPGGGGWTTTLYAAIDPRIKKSYPVSGSYPFYLRSGDQFDWGDFEETYPPLLEAADYLDLYVLGAYGEKRNQLQVIARYNECCYGGLKYQTYEEKVKEAVKNLGEGRFDIFVDEENIEETISASAITAILRDMVQEQKP